MRKKFQEGFTIVELLIALAIFSVIAASLYYTFNTGLSVWKKGNAFIEKNQKIG